MTPVQPLPKITAPTASSLTSQYKPSPAAAGLLQPSHTPAQYLSVLEQKQQTGDAIQLLAHGMPERDATWWACQSARKVDHKLLPADKDALGAAENWVKNPSPITQAHAAAAAAKTNYQGPGAWAAQAAAWSKPAAPAVPTVPGVPALAAPSLTPKAVAGSVQLSSALSANAPMPPAPPTLKAPALPTLAPPTLPPPPSLTVAPPPTPQQQAQTAKAQQPFVDLGKDTASGKNSWA